MSPYPLSSSLALEGEEIILLYKGRNRRFARPQAARRQQRSKSRQRRPSDCAKEPIVPDIHDLGDVDGVAEEQEEEEKGQIADYLDNLAANGESLTFSTFQLRDLGASDDDICFDTKQRVSESELGSADSDSEDDAAGWDDDMLGSSKRSLAKQRRAQRKNGKKKGDKSSDTQMAMNAEQIIEGLRTFVMSSNEQFSFPPFTKPIRKLIHELANRLRLKSRSLGRANTRRPCLYRTKATPKYNDAQFYKCIAGIHGRLYALCGQGSRSKRDKGAVGVPRFRDGDVASPIPELTADNRGRAMLEKMGWTTGMGLGAKDNKGILEPVPQVIKRTKAGLGNT